MGSYNHDLYSPCYYPESNMESDEYVEDPSLVSCVSVLENKMSLFLATMPSTTNTLEKILEVICHKVEMNTLIEKFKYDVSKLEEEAHSTIIEHDGLNIGVQQEFVNVTPHSQPNNRIGDMRCHIHCRRKYDINLMFNKTKLYK
ncbi:hypothetical protein PVK06_008813 [Gossypium arboreum]|uniref:Uncharacterized protein n=1 Tax=Gossypium arboreum TaxID=29729 RepID=A0ABR0QL31_GOSAR|nr:hypothetical protein PVK06_008813 [Gossypium arboreum]